MFLFSTSSAVNYMKDSDGDGYGYGISSGGESDDDGGSWWADATLGTGGDGNHEGEGWGVGHSGGVDGAGCSFDGDVTPPELLALGSDLCDYLAAYRLGVLR